MKKLQLIDRLKLMHHVHIHCKLASLCLFFTIVSCAGPKTQTSNCLVVLERLPGNSIYAFTYRCKDMVSCVNTLRQAGKVRALQALHQQILNNSQNYDPLQDKKLIYVCQILFVNLEGWSPLGGEPKTDERIAKSFPLFPIAMSDGVPFLLIDGRVINGVPSVSGAGQVRKCEGLQIIDHDLPTTGFKKAAQDLIQSELFQKLYKDPREKDRMAQEILNQAD